MTIREFRSDLPFGRRRHLAWGRHTADVITQIRERGLEAALEAVVTMGGVRQPKTVARSLLRAVERAGDVPAYRIVARRRDGTRLIDRVVEIPYVTWRYHGDRQIGRIDWLPIVVATDRQGEAVPRLPLP